jgi:hypothetical protein
MIRGMSVSTTPAIAPLRLAPDYRDFFGRAHEHLCEMIDPIVNADCYRFRVFHAPDSTSENVGVPSLGFSEYALELPVGSFLLGFLHTSCFNVTGATSPPVTSGFRVQITDVARNYKFFQKPVPDAFFLNDIVSTDPDGAFAGENLYVLNPSTRLLMAPYPIVPPGQFKVEFWNILLDLNQFISLDFVIAEPDSGGPNGNKG